MDEFGQTGETFHLALIADLAGSRDLSDRAAVQRRILTTVRELDERYRQGLRAPLELVRGDEVQTLFADPALAVPVLIALADAVHPHEWRCGLGWGKLSTALEGAVGHLDGVAFHRARAAVERAQGQRLWLCTEGLDAATADSLEALFGLLQVVRRRWTDRQLELVVAARDRPQKDVARQFGIGAPTVSESLKAAGHGAVLQAQEAAARLLDNFARKGEYRDSSPNSQKKSSAGRAAGKRPS